MCEVQCIRRYVLCAIELGEFAIAICNVQCAMCYMRCITCNGIIRRIGNLRLAQLALARGLLVEYIDQLTWDTEHQYFDSERSLPLLPTYTIFPNCTELQNLCFCFVIYG